jgi:hypothetical protein
MSITSIARSIPDFKIIQGMRGLSTADGKTVAVPVETPSSLAPLNSYTLGCRFHALLRRVADHGPLTTEEKLMLPWLNALRRQLRAMGAEHFDPLTHFSSARGLPGGEPDLVVQGGPRKHGVIEVKVVERLPASPAHEHLLQVGAYTAHMANKQGMRRTWAALVYVSFREAKIAFFIFADANAIVQKSSALMEQAA